MRIQEVERLVGITRKNIRFYEKEGLLQPGRNLENGYRDYREEDVETLKRIKLLRKLSVPLEEIRRVQSGAMTMESMLRRHMIALEEQSANLSKMQAMCGQLAERKEQYALLDTDFWLAEMEKKEKEGMLFMDVKNQDRKMKKQGAVIAAAVFGILMIAVEALLLWAYLAAPKEAPPLVLFLFFLAVPLVFLGGLFAALMQRMREIDGGEEDAAVKY